MIPVRFQNRQPEQGHNFALPIKNYNMQLKAPVAPVHRTSHRTTLDIDSYLSV